MIPEFNYPISKIEAEEIKDSRGNPTIKVTVFACPSEALAKAGAGDISDSFSVPSGASTGIHEARVMENRKAIFNVNEIISKALIGKDILNQKEVDKIMLELDGTPNKNNLGGNSMIGVSIACVKAAAKVTGQEVYQYLQTLAEIKPSRKAPYLFMNLLEGGKHAGSALAFQEYLIVSDTENISEAVGIGIKIQDTLRKIIGRDLGEESLILGDEGGFALKVADVWKPLVFLTEAIRQNNLQDKVRLALDAAASSFYEPVRASGNGIYKISGEDISKKELMDLYESLIDEFNLFSIEDPFNEEDFESFRELKEKNRNSLIVGDDLTVSNKTLLKKAIEKGSINAVIIKPNQIGTLTETLETMRLARENNIEIIISHRGEETDDDFIADLAYAFNCFGLKAGAPTKPERMVKYKRLIQITNY